MTMIDVRGLSVRSGKRTILNMGNLQFHSKTVYGIVGPNGSGKSTFLKTLCGIIENYEGDIRVDGSEAKKFHKRNARIIGSLIENPSFYPYSTPSGFIKYQIEMRTGKKVESSAQVNEIINMIGLDEKKDEMIRRLSTGELKRLGIGSAICGNPKIILLDEPTDNLDQIGKEKVEQIVNELASEEDTIVMVASHDIQFVNAVCNEIIFLKKGEVAFRYEKENDLTEVIVDGKCELLSNFPNKVEIEGNKITLRGNINDFMEFAVKNGIKIMEINRKNVLVENYKKIFGN